MHYFLRLEVVHEAHGLIVNQKKFTLELLADYNCEQLTEVSSPTAPSRKLSTDIGDILADPFSYRRIIVKLNYLTHTHTPWFSLCYSTSLPIYALSACSSLYNCYQGASLLAQVTWTRVVHAQWPLFFSILAFCDVDWASCVNFRQSLSGCFISLGASPISWKSKKQVFISLSSAEAEHRSMHWIVVELTWIDRLLHDLLAPATTYSATLW